MKKVTQEEFTRIIERHLRFLSGKSGGQRAVVKFMDLSNVDFGKADLSNADFSGCKLDHANLSESTFVSACFFGCSMYKADMRSANFVRCDMRGANIMGANLSKANFGNADFRQGFIMNYETDDDEAWRKDGKTEFSGSTIMDTNMSGVMAQYTDFSDANLRGVIMKEANLSEANLSGANLAETDLTGSNLAKAKMERANVKGTKLDGVVGDLSTMRDLAQDLASQKKIDEEGTNIKALVEQHSAWVESAGKKGKQLNLSGYDLSKEETLKDYPLTLLIAKDCHFVGLNLNGAKMQSSVLDDSDFRDCSAILADFRGTSFKNAAFTRANLSGADFSSLKVETDGKDITRPVNLEGAKMNFAKLENAKFKGANLKNADFSHANIKGADFADCNLEGAIFDETGLSPTASKGKTDEEDKDEDQDEKPQDD